MSQKTDEFSSFVAAMCLLCQRQPVGVCITVIMIGMLPTSGYSENIRQHVKKVKRVHRVRTEDRCGSVKLLMTIAAAALLQDSLQLVARLESP